MTSSSYFLPASFLFFEEQSTFMCWSLHCEWPVPLISLWHLFFSFMNSLCLCVDHCIVDDQFLLFSLGHPFCFFEEKSNVYVLIVALWMTSSSYFHVGILSFLRRTVYVYVLIVVLWMTMFLLFPCGILSSLRRTVYVYVLIVVLWMTSSSYFLAVSLLFFEEQSTFMCWSLHCGWPVHLISLWHPFFSSKNSLLLCVDHCIVDDQFLLFPCGIISFLWRTVYVYVLIIVLWMTSSSYFLWGILSVFRRKV